MFWTISYPHCLLPKGKYGLLQFEYTANRIIIRSLFQLQTNKLLCARIDLRISLNQEFVLTSSQNNCAMCIHWEVVKGRMLGQALREHKKQNGKIWEQRIRDVIKYYSEVYLFKKFVSVRHCHWFHLRSPPSAWAHSPFPSWLFLKRCWSALSWVSSIAVVSALMAWFKIFTFTFMACQSQWTRWVKTHRIVFMKLIFLGMALSCPIRYIF